MKILQTTLHAILLGAVLATVTQAVLADSNHPHSHATTGNMAHEMPMPTQASPMAAQTTPAASPMADMYTQGEIRKVDTAQGKLTIKHGDIKNLGMPGMTMIFKVQSPQMLDGLKAGDAVQFVVQRQNGGLLITDLKKSQGQ